QPANTLTMQETRVSTTMKPTTINRIIISCTGTNDGPRSGTQTSLSIIQKDAVTMKIIKLVKLLPTTDFRHSLSTEKKFRKATSSNRNGLTTIFTEQHFRQPIK